MKMKPERGFTLTELVVVVSAVMVIALPLRNLIDWKDAAKEAQVKVNIHDIRIAVERYSIDFGGSVPAYIFGGDLQGWDEETGCRALTEPATFELKPPKDPLIEFGYLAEYPTNPFIIPGGGRTSTISWTGGSLNLGDGDVRFGWDGEKMGNCLDDPRLLFDGYGNPTRLANTMIPKPSHYIGVLDPNTANSFYAMGGLSEWDRNMPGWTDPLSPPIKAFWPGQFFYRACGDFDLSSHLDGGVRAVEYIWDWPYRKLDRYIIGGYGSPRTDGLDVIRLTTVESYNASIQSGAINGIIEGQYYQDNQNPDIDASHPGFSTRVVYSNPEVFGGGERGLMPQFPYYETSQDEWLYGAPDGIPDGVVIVLISEDPRAIMEF